MIKLDLVDFLETNCNLIFHVLQDQIGCPRLLFTIQGKKMLIHLTKYFVSLSVCLFVCLFVCITDKRAKTAEPIWPKFIVEPQMIQR